MEHDGRRTLYPRTGFPALAIGKPHIMSETPFLPMLFDTPETHDPGGKVRLKLPGGIVASAEMSPCTKYRYSLERIWDITKPTILWIGMNPSTADALHDDPTCAREMTFSKTWGYGQYWKANVMDWRATFPKDIPTDPQEAISSAGRQKLLAMASTAKMVIAAWGKPPGKLELEARALAKTLQGLNITLYCLGTNQDGSPKHPLYLKKSLTPIPWTGYPA